MPRVDLDKYREAGRIAAECHALAREAIKPGARYLDVLDAVEDHIFACGAQIAFPAQVSVNEVAAHDCSGPDDPRTFKIGDVAKLDIGVHVDGCIGDTARTIDLGANSLLLEACKQALEAAIALVRPGVKVRELSHAIRSTMDALGLRPVGNLTGHGIAPYSIHCSPSIPNVPEGATGILKEGMMICIEPFATTGSGRVVEQGEAEVFGARRRLKAPRHVHAGVVEQIEARKGLPFSRRELARKHGTDETEEALDQLLRAGVVHDYPPLVETAGVGALVSQFEHTMYVGREGPEVMTRDR